VQRHAASRLHFDFRLELKGALKSWAVPRGPSLNPLDQRLAVAVEDHPLEYGKFEGIIPKGNYGAGTVMIWDHGTYRERTSKTRLESERKIAEGLARGHITFLLDGKKLRGEFALIKLNRGEENAWLLVKKRDEFSTYKRYAPDELSAQTGRTTEQIARESAEKNKIWISKAASRPKASPKPDKKDLPASRDAKKEKSPSRQAMPRRVKPMLPTIASVMPDEGDWQLLPWPGGLRAVAEVDRGSVHLYSRFFLPYERKFPTLAAALRRLDKDLVLDGEILAGGKGATHYLVYDLLYADGEDLRALPLSERSRCLSNLDIFDETIRFGKPVSASSKKDAGYLLARREDSPYRSGTSGDWLKVKAAQGARAKVPSIEVPRPIFSHLQKVLFPRDGLTKGDVIEYYRRVAPVLLPHLKDRPESLHRHPDGIERQSFFHKDMTSYLPRWIETVRISSRSSEKTINYLLCQNEATLLFLANYGCIELNPWISRVKRLDSPDYSVIDLDPDDNSFEEVVEVAKETHRVLESIGAKGYCKTSGATGIHICIPTQGSGSYDEAREFARAVCEIVHERFPKNTSLERNPAKRRRRIYLDFMQNRRGQTLAAPYSLRPRPGATVSTPLRWNELKSGLDPKDFTIANIPRRIERLGDLWAPMLSERVNLVLCLRRLRRKSR